MNVITIAIPVYNVEKYIEKSLLSALNQDFCLPYEILIINDSSPDNSMDIVHRLKKEHSKGNIIRIIDLTQNRGQGDIRIIVVHGLLIAVASLVAEHRLQACRLQ